MDFPALPHNCWIAYILKLYLESPYPITWPRDGFREDASACPRLALQLEALKAAGVLTGPGAAVHA